MHIFAVDEEVQAADALVQAVAAPRDSEQAFRGAAGARVSQTVI
jgi:hypothetical protein